MGILQAKILEWVVIPPPGDLPNPGIEPRSPAQQADSLPSEPPEKHLGTHCIYTKATEESPGPVQSILKEREHTGKF